MEGAWRVHGDAPRGGHPGRNELLARPDDRRGRLQPGERLSRVRVRARARVSVGLRVGVRVGVGVGVTVTVTFCVCHVLASASALPSAPPSAPAAGGDSAPDLARRGLPAPLRPPRPAPCRSSAGVPTHLWYASVPTHLARRRSAAEGTGTKPAPAQQRKPAASASASDLALGLALGLALRRGLGLVSASVASASDDQMDSPSASSFARDLALGAAVRSSVRGIAARSRSRLLPLTPCHTIPTGNTSGGSNSSGWTGAAGSLAISFRDGLNGRIRYICTGVAGGGVSTTRGGTRGNGGRQGPRLLTGWRG